jgi:phosphatidylglycerol:prolipoprotein diacylglycerol transferase
VQAGLPYFTLPELGPFKPFGILVAIGVLIGARLIYRRTERLGLNMEHARGLVIWSAVIGFIGAHVIDVLAYQMDDLKRDPWLLIKIWGGISSYGGFIGGTAGFFLYALRHRLPLAVWADSLVAGLMVGFTFGRLGCTIVHDHIGRATDFPLGQYYSEQVIREHGYPIQAGVHHNLGLYEFGFCLALVGILFLVDRKPRRPGTIVGVIATLYAPVRFLMDYLRLEVTDPRYFGLTFAQWTSVLTLAIGLFMLGRVLVLKPSLEEAVAADAAAAKAFGLDPEGNAGKGGAGKGGAGKAASGKAGTGKTGARKSGKKR